MINELIVDYNKNDTITNIENSGSERVNTFTTRINFYNPLVDIPLHKFWFFIPNAKLIKKKQNMIQIVLSRNEKNLINSINSLDNLVNNITQQYNTDIKYINPSIIQSNNYPPILELMIDNYSRCYNNNDEVINYLLLNNGEKIQLYIEFESVIINSTQCTKKWKVLQMKKEKNIDMTVNLFNIPQPPPIQSYIPQPPKINNQINIQINDVVKIHQILQHQSVVINHLQKINY